MNKSFAMFLVLVAFIAVFAVVVMVQVPRKGIVMDVPAVDNVTPVVTAMV